MAFVLQDLVCSKCHQVRDGWDELEGVGKMGDGKGGEVEGWEMGEGGRGGEEGVGGTGRMGWEGQGG